MKSNKILFSSPPPSPTDEAYLFPYWRCCVQQVMMNSSGQVILSGPLVPHQPTTAANQTSSLPPPKTGSSAHSTGSVVHQTGNIPPHQTSSIPQAGAGSLQQHPGGSMQHQNGSIQHQAAGSIQHTGSIPHTAGSHPAGSIPHQSGSLAAHQQPHPSQSARIRKGIN